ncbi:MAG: hypothetical protein JSU74_02265 [Candidatus Zixiibacteriota bacterium]|nr:MAG: hypothetical protein JSU74_02265 [candidate division Zixibacteria bacterium]
MNACIGKMLIALMPFWLIPMSPVSSAETSDTVETQVEWFLEGYRGCMEDEFDEDRPDIRTDQSAVIWECDGQGALYLWHLNSAFNCCTELLCDVSVDSNVITITEAELGACDCVCLFDVDYCITGLERGVYLVRFEELYLGEEDEEIEFRIFVGSEPSSNLILAYRSSHPWKSDGSAWGKRLTASDVDILPEIFILNPPTSGDCILWAYEDNVLRLRRQGAELGHGNCLSVAIDVSGNVIMLEEFAYHCPRGRPSIKPIEPGPDVWTYEMKIYNLPLKRYQVIMAGPLGEWEAIVDLPYQPSGYFCFGE